MTTRTSNFYTNADELVAQALQAAVLNRNDLALDPEHKIVYRKRKTVPAGRVSIVSGGGSGHEPGFTGFVGHGLLTAAVAGTIFASPSTEQVRTAILDRVPTEQGVLVLTMAYTGDILNFGIAVEKARSLGVKVAFLAIGDDVSIGRKKTGKVGRRGLAGTLLVVKILGALAETGASLDQLLVLGQQLSGNLMTIGASLQHVVVPGRPVDIHTQSIPSGEVELGMGIHNETGCCRMSCNLVTLVSTMLSQLLDRSDDDRHFVDVNAQDGVVLLVNNLGGTSPLEIAGITAELCQQLRQNYSIVPARVLTGTYLTSLNALGWSTTLLKIPNIGPSFGRTVLQLLDDQASMWPQPYVIDVAHGAHDDTDQRRTQPWTPTGGRKNVLLKCDMTRALSALYAGLRKVTEAEPEITHFDTIVGDGDCGAGFKRGAEYVHRAVSSRAHDLTDAIGLVQCVVTAIEHSMDGTSGAIFTIFTTAMLASLLTQAQAGQNRAGIRVWCIALQDALTTLGRYTPATKGDRTLLDSLIPFIETLSAQGDVKKAADASVEGAESTKFMTASLGRTAYVGNEESWIGVVPDPGAFGLSKLLEGIASGLQQ